MKIAFQNIIPSFLSGSSQLPSEVWGKEYIFSEGEKILVSAQSGKGKSTLLACLFGARNSYSGNIFFDDKNIRELNLYEWSNLRKTKLSIVFQELRLFDDLTVKENIDLKLKHSSANFNEAMNMLAMVGIESFVNKPCRQLSMGQRQRVAIVRSLLQPFEWLLMDEPFSHLDDMNATRCLQVVEEVAAKNRAGYILTTLGNSQFPLTAGKTFNKTLNL